MDKSKTYGMRSIWLWKHFGTKYRTHDRLMEDKETKLFVFEFEPSTVEGGQRRHWTYATNGIAHRRMPCENEPHGDPEIRVELIGYASRETPLLVDYLAVLAGFPFIHRSGLAPYQTLSLTDHPFWSGLLFLIPPAEIEEFSPQRVYSSPDEDTTVYLQIMGLKKEELAFAIEHGGYEFWKQFEEATAGQEPFARFFLDLDREPIRCEPPAPPQTSNPLEDAHRENAMLTIGEKKFCCYLIGEGTLDEEEYEDSEDLMESMPGWIKDQGEFKIDMPKWLLSVGISHEDEEWRQDEDMKDFLVEAFAFLDELTGDCNSGKLTLVMNYSNAPHSMCSIDSATAGLLSALKINLDICWGGQSGRIGVTH